MVRVKHAGDSIPNVRGLTTNPESVCVDGVSSEPGATTIVQDGVATIWTCSASQFGGGPEQGDTVIEGAQLGEILGDGVTNNLYWDNGV